MSQDDPKEEVLSVVYTMEHPHSINWVAETAGVQWETAEKYLKEFQQKGLVIEVDGEYKPNSTGLYIREIRKLIVSHTAEELVESAQELESKIKEIKDDFDVDSISQLEEQAEAADSVSEQRRLYDVIDGLRQQEELLRQYRLAISIQRDAERQRYQQRMEELGSEEEAEEISSELEADAYAS